MLAIACSPLFGRIGHAIPGARQVDLLHRAADYGRLSLRRILAQGHGKAAYATMLTGAVLGGIVFVLDLFTKETGWNVNYMMAASTCSSCAAA